MSLPPNEATSTIKMTIEEWEDVSDNPIQRDTVVHATKSSKPGGHLSKPHETHRQVDAARLPNGKLYKLDGHSRSWLWSEELLAPPELLPGGKGPLVVTIYPLKTRQEVIEFYRTFDNSSATETQRDKLFGAFRIHKFYPKHGYLFHSSGLMGAIKYACFPDHPGMMRTLPFEDMVKPWIKTLKSFDGGDFTNHYAFRSAVMLAAILTIRRDGNTALSFWQAYADGGGSKSAKSCDGIYSAEDIYRTMTNEAANRWGTRILGIYTPYFLHSYDAWVNKKRIKPFGNIMGKRMPDDMFTVREWWDVCIGKTDQQHLQQSLDL